MQTQEIGPGKGLEAIGGAIEKSSNYLYAKLDDARRYAEKSKYEVYKTQTMADLRLAEDQELNPDGSPKTDTDISSFTEKLKKAKEGYKGIFTTKDGQMEADADWDKNSLVMSNDVLKSRYKNIGLVAKANDAVRIRGLEASFDGSPEAEQKIRDAYSNRLIYDPVEADKETESALKKGRWNWFTGIVKSKGIEEARDMVTGKQFGFDSETDDKALSYLEHAKNLDDKNTIINKIDNRFNLVDAISQGKEDVYNLSPQAQAMVDGDEVLSAAVNKAKQSKQGYLTDTTEAENYVKVFDEASKVTDRDALSSLATSLIYRDKAITPDKLGLVLFYAGQRAKNLNLSEKVLSTIGNETTQEQIQALQMDAGVNRIARWSGDWDISDKEHVQTTFDFLSKVKAGEKPFEALNATIQSANLRIHPEMVTYPKEGQMLVDAKGRYSMAYPDGTIKPIGRPATKSKTSNAPKQESTSKEGLSWENL